MTEKEVISIMRDHLESQFPKVCPCCNLTMTSLREYLLITEHLGPAISYDAECGRWRPSKPWGAITYANCPCGTTISLSSADMSLSLYWWLMKWARIETQRRQMTPTELLTYLRDEISKQVLDEAALP